MKVLLVGTGAHSIPPTGYGAVERILSEYADALRRIGHSVRILNEARGGGAFAEYRFALGLPRLVRREEYDVLHASTPVVANRLAGARIPYVYTSHSRHWFWRASWRHRWGFWLERRAVRQASAVVALTDEVEAAMRRSVAIPSTRPMRVIPYGVDSAGFAPALQSRTGRRALGVGIVVPLKRWEIAAAALKGTGMTLRIAGPVLDGSYADRVRAAGSGVELLGEVDEPQLRRLYAESDVLVHPSIVEILPRAVLEGMASGLPVVGSSAVASLLQDGKAGFSAAAGSSDDELVAFMRRSVGQLEKDPALRREMGTVARERVRDTYSWDRVVAAHIDLYRATGVPVA